MARPKFIAGNWKMYTNSAAEATQLAAAVHSGLSETNTLVAVCPPFPWLSAVVETLKESKIAVGAQDCHFSSEGAFTGSVAPGMIVSTGCSYVIIGHSERRHGLNESDELLNKKLKAALSVGLKVIFCIGELLAEREAEQTEQVLARQLTAGLDGLSGEQMQNVVIAYEPVWAIGTGKVATTEQAQSAHAFVRQKIAEQFGETIAQAVLIQYGGSVKPENAAALLAQPDIDGALVGGASLKAEQFLAIVAAAPQS